MWSWRKYFAGTRFSPYACLPTLMLVSFPQFILIVLSKQVPPFLFLPVYRRHTHITKINALFLKRSKIKTFPLNHSISLSLSFSLLLLLLLLLLLEHKTSVAVVKWYCSVVAYNMPPHIQKPSSNIYSKPLVHSISRQRLFPLFVSSLIPPTSL